LASERTELPGRNWGVQVGAYANRQLAVQAAGSAHGMVTHASTVVATTHSGHAVLYRARLGGMTHEAAVAACHRLAHKNGGCLLVSPASQ
jgi:ornithine cyclodeaminase/alanine dehydrogenase-like protein (mu-crystallin family)